MRARRNSFGWRSVLINFLTLVIAALPACSGGSSGNDLPSNEMAVMAVDLMSDPAEVYIGRPITLNTTLVVSQDDENIGISYYILNKADVDAEAENPRQYRIGGDVWPEAITGASVRLCRLFIPESEELPDEASDAGAEAVPGNALVPGAYYLAAYVDELDTRNDSDRSDNSLIDKSRVIDLKATALPDIVINRVLEVEDDVVLLHSQDALSQAPVPGFVDHANEHFDATLVVSAVGTSAITNVELTAYFDLSGGSVDGTSQLLPLDIWTSSIDPVSGIDNGHYAGTYVLPNLEPGIETSVHMDFHVPPATRAALIQAMNSTSEFVYTLVIKADEDDLIAEFEGAGSITGRDDDNEISADLVVIPPNSDPQPDEVEYEREYKKDWSNNYFGVGVHAQAEAKFDEGGATNTLQLAVPLKILGKNREFIGLTIDARHDPAERSDSIMSVMIDMFGTTVWQANKGAGFTKSFDPIVEHEFKKESKTIWLEIVPITVTGKVFGGIEIELDVGIDDQFYIEVKPKVIGLAATVTAGVGVSGLQGGVGGTLTLLDDTITFRTDCGMALVNNDTALQGQLGLKVTNVIRGPNGRFFAFAEWPTIHWSWRHGFSKKTAHKEHTLVEWVPFSETDVLFHKTAPIITIALQ